MIRLALPAVVMALTACGAKASAPAASTPNPPESVAPPADPAPAPAAIARPPEVRSMPAELLVRPAVSGTGNLLFLGATARVDSVSVTFSRSAHTQVGRITTGTFDFVLAKAGKKVDLQIETDQQKFQAEVVAHGALFVFEQRSDEMFTVLLASAAAPPPLDEPACLDLIDQAATRAGITDRSTTTTTEEGILRVRRASWTAYCGRYTKRVWFSPRTEADATP